MFESDDFDQILSQLDLPEACSNISVEKPENQDVPQDCFKCDANKNSQLIHKFTVKLPNEIKENVDNFNIRCANITDKDLCKETKHNIDENNYTIEENTQLFPKHSKRKLINSYFDAKTKRKFPGPAGVLNGTFEGSKEIDDICHVELLSQDIDYSEAYICKGIFESPIWARILQDTKEIKKLDTINNIKVQALKGNLRHQKAEAIAAYVESVDRSAIDPLIILRDATEAIKCTLHRDAWVAFSPYIVSECCAFVLRSPTVLTTGSAFKKHYLNITLRNIQAVYSSAIIKREEESFPKGFIKVYDDDYTIIRNENQNIYVNSHPTEFENSNFLDGLDGAFSDDIFS